MALIDPDGLHHQSHSTPLQHNAVTSDRLFETALAFWRSAILLSAHELGVFAELAAGPRAPEALVRRLGLLPDAAGDLLDALVTLGLLEHCGTDYRNTCEASLYLDPAKPTYIGRWLAMAGDAMHAMTDLAARLRVPTAQRQEQPGLAARMWADIAGILREAYPRE
jgi:hypothetical protein